MKRSLLLAGCTLSLSLGAMVNPALLQDFRNRQDIQQDVQINNRVLASPNDKPITVLDVAKRLEMVFRRAYPELVDSPQSRYQFYQVGWKETLNELIDNALIMADAEEKHFACSDGEIRREMEEMFGPNVVETIDKLGLSFEDAWEIVETDLIVNQMKMGFVTSRAIVSISPEKVRKAYEDYTAEMGDKDEWAYQMLTIRHKDKEVAASVAEQAKALIEVTPEVSLDSVKGDLIQMRDAGDLDVKTVVSVSGEEQRTLDTLAKTHRDVLIDLSPGTCSEPVAQVSRADQSTVYRIFHLIDHIEKHPPEYGAIENDLRGHLMQVAAGEEYRLYIGRLRDRYGIDEEYLRERIPDTFQPFRFG